MYGRLLPHGDVAHGEHAIGTGARNGGGVE